MYVCVCVRVRVPFGEVARAVDFQKPRVQFPTIMVTHIFLLSFHFPDFSCLFSFCEHLAVGLASSLAPVGSGTFACSNGTKSTINISAMVYVPNGEDWQPIPLRYEFDFRRPKVQPLLVGGPVSARRSVVAVMRSNDTSVTLHQPWVCGDYESGTWDVVLQVRNDVDNTLLAYASATIFVTSKPA